jgi:putative methionine-R-sulfoxide reductase with GAF domain
MGSSGFRAPARFTSLDLRGLRTPPREPGPDQPEAAGRPSRSAVERAGGGESLELELARARAEREELLAREQAAVAASDSALRRLRAIEYVTEAALEHLDEGDLLAEVLRRVRQVLDADAATVHLLGASGSSLVLRSWSGLDVASREDAIVPNGLGVVGRAVRERAPVVIADTAAEPELSSAFRQAVRSLLAVPLVSRERVLGALQVCWARWRSTTRSSSARPTTSARGGRRWWSRCSIRWSSRTRMGARST